MRAASHSAPTMATMSSAIDRTTSPTLDDPPVTRRSIHPRLVPAAKESGVKNLGNGQRPVTNTHECDGHAVALDTADRAGAERRMHDGIIDLDAARHVVGLVD